MEHHHEPSHVVEVKLQHLAVSVAIDVFALAAKPLEPGPTQNELPVKTNPLWINLCWLTGIDLKLLVGNVVGNLKPGSAKVFFSSWRFSIFAKENK